MIRLVSRKKAKPSTAKIKKAKPRHLFLLTSLTDDQAYPYAEVAQLYLSRWEIEFAFREIKATLTNRKVEFRSKKPRRVLQEAYALLLAYNAIRMRMAQAARTSGIEPRRLSFKRCLEAVRRAYLRGDLRRLLCQLARHVLTSRPQGPCSRCSRRGFPGSPLWERPLEHS